MLAAGVNNTDINTRLGWYSSPEKPDGGWNIATPFPFIQGTDFDYDGDHNSIVFKTYTPRASAVIHTKYATAETW